MKNIKLFEQFSEDYQTDMEIFDSIYEDWKAENGDNLKSILEGEQLNLFPDDEDDANLPFNNAEDAADDEDDDWGDDDAELTSGERAALARDFQIMSKPQLAALYLRALGKVRDNHYGAYTVMINGITPFGKVTNEGVFNITNPAFADAIGLDSSVTVSRTIKKFRLLITGEGANSGESIYPKIINAFNQFRNRTPGQIAALAAEAIQDPATSTMNREAAAAAGPRTAARNRERKANQIKLGETVDLLVKSLGKADIYRNQIARAERAAIAKIARDFDVTPERVQLAYQAFKKTKEVR
jgi:hypothetical protein